MKPILKESATANTSIQNRYKCGNCGYSIKPNWKACPMCATSIHILKEQIEADECLLMERDKNG